VILNPASLITGYVLSLSLTLLFLSKTTSMNSLLVWTSSCLSADLEKRLGLDWDFGRGSGIEGSISSSCGVGGALISMVGNFSPITADTPDATAKARVGTFLAGLRVWPEKRLTFWLTPS